MADKVINTLTNISPLPSEGREKYLFPVVKTGGAVPEGGNFSLKDLLEPLEMKDAAQDAAIAQKADKEAQRVIDEAQDDQIAKNRTAVKDLRMLSDTLLFQTDSDGFPIPSQVAHVHVDKPYCEGALTYEGKTIPEGTVDFTVEPKDMTNDGVVLKNSFTQSDDDWKESLDENETLKIFKVGKINPEHKYYMSVEVRYTGEQEDKLVMQVNGRTGLVNTYVKSPKAETIYKLSKISKGSDVDIPWVFLTPYKTTVRKYSRYDMCIDITDLSARYPQYSDEQLKTILDASLPYISAGQSKTLGGVIQLENLVPNPTFADNAKGWTAETGVTKTVNGNAVTLTGTTQYSQFYSSKFSAKKVDGVKFFISTGLMSSIKDKWLLLFNNSTAQKGINITDKPYGMVSLTTATTTPCFVAYSYFTPNSTDTITISSPKLIDTTDSLLDLWLSLNGYDTNEKKADWCNRHIPPFEGTFDLVLSMRDELTITAKCDGLMKALTFKKAISDFRVTSVVESGEGYQKYADGTLIQWGYSSKEVDFPTAWANTYRGLMQVRHTYQLPFIDKPSVSVCPNINVNYCEILGCNTTATGLLEVAIARPYNSKVNIAIYWQAIGRWK